MINAPISADGLTKESLAVSDDLGRKLVALVSIFALWFGGMVATAPTASAHFCNHSSHEHYHNGHWDYYHYHGHYPEHGMHFHTWHNHTHNEYPFSTRC